jgi:hypothetical protein
VALRQDIIEPTEDRSDVELATGTAARAGVQR